MVYPSRAAELIADRVVGLPFQGRRKLIAIAGPPASGKTTCAQAVCHALSARGDRVGLVAMDGFHLDNGLLEARGLRSRKGAPETFDLGGFTSVLHRLALEDEVVVPTFDRVRDISVGASAVVASDVTTVVVEGNYLLLDAPGWRDLADVWDFSVFFSVPMADLEKRLLQRWIDLGLGETVAREKVHGNDLPNARFVLENSLEADLMIES